MPLLKNKIAVITGGSSGIGLATVKRFVEEGAYVFIAARRQTELDEAVAEIGRNVTGVKTDISKLDDIDRLYQAVAKKGKVDVVFASAAFVEKVTTAAATPEHFNQTFNTNARGTYFTVQKALPYLNDGASIILVASAGKGHGPARPQHLQRHESGAEIISTHVDERIQGSKDQNQCAEPRAGRHADVRRAVPVQGGRCRSQNADDCDNPVGQTRTP